VLDFTAPVLGKLSARGLAHLRSRTLAQLGGACGACSSNKTAVHRSSTRRGQVRP
jgi:Fe-S cluster biogenesis protein NfuA